MKKTVNITDKQKVMNGGRAMMVPIKPLLFTYTIFKRQVNGFKYLPPLSLLDALLSSFVCTFHPLIRAAIYFNKAAGISCGGEDNVCGEDPAAVQIRDIDLALSSTGQSSSQRGHRKGNRITQLASWTPALIITPIRKKMSRCSSGYIMLFSVLVCPHV